MALNPAECAPARSVNSILMSAPNSKAFGWNINAKIKQHWNPTLVADRLEEAANVLNRLPPVKVQGYVSAWPRIIYDPDDLADQEPELMKRPPPNAKSISHMEEALSWTVGLDPVDAKIIWLRADRQNWKTICSKVGLSRKAAFDSRLYGLQIIAWRLNGKIFSKLPSKNFVLTFMRMQKRKLEQ